MSLKEHKSHKTSNASDGHCMKEIPTIIKPVTLYANDHECIVMT